MSPSTVRPDFREAVAVAVYRRTGLRLERVQPTRSYHRAAVILDAPDGEWHLTAYLRRGGRRGPGLVLSYVSPRNRTR